MKAQSAAIALGLALCSRAARAEPDAPFEPAPRHARGVTERVDAAPRFQPITGAALAIIHSYQESASERSTARCPFSSSCSRFASDAVEREGVFVGVLRFLDRFFYRENRDLRHHYRILQTPDRGLRFDDSIESK